MRGVGHRRIDLSGQRVGRLLVLAPEQDELPSHLKRSWLCRCDCGAQVSVRGDALTKATPTRSCGCLQKERASGTLRNWWATGTRRGSGYRHGHAGKRPSPTYNSWSAMRQRCRYIKHVKYPRYGGRGILVADRWFDSFEAFLEDMGERPPGTTLDRKDPRGHYEPGNCRWSTPYQQWLNRQLEAP